MFCVVVSGEELKALDLFTAYLRNEVAAGAKYTGEEVTVNGLIREIGVGVDGRPFLRIDLDPFEYDLYICNFSKENAYQFENLTVWNQVTITGRILGVFKKRYIYGEHAVLIMEDCSIDGRKKSKTNLMIEEFHDK